MAAFIIIFLLHSVNRPAALQKRKAGQVFHNTMTLNIPDISTGIRIMSSGTGSASFMPDTNDPDAADPLLILVPGVFPLWQSSNRASTNANEISFFGIPVANPGFYIEEAAPPEKVINYPPEMIHCFQMRQKTCLV